MIVETLLNDFSWSEDCIKCDDPGKAFVVYNFLRELLLDSHLYVTKVVGFHIKNKTQRKIIGIKCKKKNMKHQK